MLFLLLTIVLCIPLVLFALSNPTPVHLTLWPTDYVLDAPLSIDILVAMAVAFLLGAVIVWFSSLAQRRRARRAERTVRLLQAQIESLKAENKKVRAAQAAPAPGRQLALPPAA
ncbi:MAG: lipopolysaccharide assembly protein LapA domain-containing protein [Rhodopila sp.]|jgi:lipopolysaccharide assembly protein A